MSRRRATPPLTARLALVPALALAVAPAPTTARGATEPSAAPSAPGLLVVCAGEPFPATALAGPRGAERGADAPARRLAAAIADAPVSPESPPRTGWIRAVDRPDLVLFIAPIIVRRDSDEPLFAIGIAPGSTARDALEGWNVGAAGPCRPRVVLPDGLGAADWVPAAPVGHATQAFIALLTESACNDGQPATGRVSVPVIVSTATSVEITFGVQPRPGDHDCPSNPPTPVVVPLPEPLGRRALVDGSVAPGRVVQASPEPRAPLAAGEGLPLRIVVAAVPAARTMAIARAITDTLQGGVKLRRVRVVDTLRLVLTISADVDITLAAPPRLCLVGPHPAPDDAGLSDRCWGTPDLSALVATRLPLDERGRPVLRAGAPITIVADLARGTARCDYPAGDWTLEVTVTPQLLGRPLLEQRLADVPVAIPWQGHGPMPELSRADSRYCGIANVVHDEQGEPPAPPGG